MGKYLGGPSALLLLAWLVASCGLTADEVPAEWVLRSPPAVESLQLTVAVGVPCNRLQPVRVEETASEVAIFATVRRSDEACDAMFVTEEVEVTLDRPLGDRTLRGCEAPSGDDVVRLDLSNPGCLRVGG